MPEIRITINGNWETRAVVHPDTGLEIIQITLPVGTSERQWEDTISAYFIPSSENEGEELV